MIYQFSNKNRLLVFLLCVVILFNAFFVAVESADASITLTAGTLAVLCSVLVASGFVFQNSDELSKAASSIWASLSETQREFFVTSGTTYLDYVTSNEPFVVKLSKDICSAIGSWLGSLGATADAPSVSVPVSGSASGSLPFSFNYKDLPYVSNLPSGNAAKDSYFASHLSSGVQVVPNVYLFKDYISAEKTALYLHFVYDGEIGGNMSDHTMPLIFLSSSYQIVFHPVGYNLPLRLDFRADSANNVLALFDSAGVRVATGIAISSKAREDLFSSTGAVSVSIPWTGGYAPGYGGEKELDDSTGIVVPGKLIHDGAIDSDFVGTLTPDAVRDVSTDVAGDGILDWVKSIANTLANFFDVSQFTLDFSPFEIGLSKVFPFCIPFDFYNGIKLFSAQAADFSFDIKLDTDYFKIDHTVNLAPFRLPILFFRYIVVFWFSWILISRTRDLMKW